MNAIVRLKTGPSLSELYPPFKLWLAIYNRLSKAGKAEEAERAFETAQMIAAAWRAGAEYGARQR